MDIISQIYIISYQDLNKINYPTQNLIEITNIELRKRKIQKEEEREVRWFAGTLENESIRFDTENLPFKQYFFV